VIPFLFATADEELNDEESGRLFQNTPDTPSLDLYFLATGRRRSL